MSGQPEAAAAAHNATVLTQSNTDEAAEAESPKKENK